VPAVYCDGDELFKCNRGTVQITLKTCASIKEGETHEETKDTYQRRLVMPLSNSSEGMVHRECDCFMYPLEKMPSWASLTVSRCGRA
jgi:hypothetical protein